jgi:sortase B
LLAVFCLSARREEQSADTPMKKRGWDLAASLARGGDHLLNAVIAVLLVTALLYGGFGLWDTGKIYLNAAVSDEMLEYKPTANGDDTPNPTISELEAYNPDVCGWLTVDDTNIDYYIVQGETNMTYVNKAVDQSFSLSGSIFLDYRNARDFTDPFSLIYGHHMEGEVMFGEIPYFTDSEYFQEHQTGNIFTADHTYYIKWFACLETDAYDDMIYNPTIYNERASLDDLLDYLKENATQYRDIGVTGSDQLVALTTCASTSTDGRVVLVGRMS